VPAIRDYIRIIPDDPLGTLRKCGGYYECPKDSQGERLGPLVGYAGDYTTPDGRKEHFVGDIYANLAKAEEHSRVLVHFATRLVGRLSDSPDFNLLLGAPMGGIRFAGVIGQILDCRAIYAEKKVVALASGDEREQSVLAFKRHQPQLGDKVMIVEDICNNFSTTSRLISLVEQADAQVVGIVCFLNRSKLIRFGNLPIIALVHRPMPEYKQDDPEVVLDITEGNVVWKPKDHWDELQAAMEEAA